MAASINTKHSRPPTHIRRSMSQRTCAPDTQQTTVNTRMHCVRCRTPCRSPSMHIHQSPPPFCCRLILYLSPPTLRVHELPFRCPPGSYSAIMYCGDGRRSPSSRPSGSLRRPRASVRRSSSPCCLRATGGVSVVRLVGPVGTIRLAVALADVPRAPCGSLQTATRGHETRRAAYDRHE